MKGTLTNSTLYISTEEGLVWRYDRNLESGYGELKNVTGDLGEFLANCVSAVFQSDQQGKIFLVCFSEWVWMDERKEGIWHKAKPLPCATIPDNSNVEILAFSEGRVFATCSSDLIQVYDVTDSLNLSPQTTIFASVTGAYFVPAIDQVCDCAEGKFFVSGEFDFLGNSSERAYGIGFFNGTVWETINVPGVNLTDEGRYTSLCFSQQGSLFVFLVPPCGGDTSYLASRVFSEGVLSKWKFVEIDTPPSPRLSFGPLLSNKEYNGLLQFCTGNFTVVYALDLISSKSPQLILSVPTFVGVSSVLGVGNTIFLTGFFTYSIEEMTFSNILRYDISSFTKNDGSLFPIKGPVTPSGAFVKAAWIDSASMCLFVGGKFSSIGSVKNLANIAAYDIRYDTWDTPVTRQLQQLSQGNTVESIVKGSEPQSSLFFTTYSPSDHKRPLYVLQSGFSKIANHVEAISLFYVPSGFDFWYWMYLGGGFSLALTFIVTVSICALNRRRRGHLGSLSIQAEQDELKPFIDAPEINMKKKEIEEIWEDLKRDKSIRKFKERDFVLKRMLDRGGEGEVYLASPSCCSSAIPNVKEVAIKKFIGPEGYSNSQFFYLRLFSLNPLSLVFFFNKRSKI